MTNTIIDPIIYFKERNSYFFVPLHDGWRFTKVNNQPPSATALWALPFSEVLLFLTSLSQMHLKQRPGYPAIINVVHRRTQLISLTFKRIHSVRTVNTMVEFSSICPECYRIPHILIVTNDIITSITVNVIKYAAINCAWRMVVEIEGGSMLVCAMSGWFKWGEDGWLSSHMSSVLLLFLSWTFSASTPFVVRVHDSALVYSYEYNVSS